MAWNGIIKTVMDRLNALGEGYPETYGLAEGEFVALRNAVAEYQNARKRPLPNGFGPFLFRDVWIHKL